MNGTRMAWLCTGLAALSLCASAAPPRAGAADDAAKQLAAIEQRFEEEQGQFYAVYRAAKTDEERAAARAKRPGAQYIPEFLAVAEQAKGTETAAKAWVWVVDVGLHHDVDAAKVGLEALLSEHIRSELLAELPTQLRYAVEPLGRERVSAALRKLADGSPHARVQAGALFTLGAVLIGEDAKASDADRKEARALFERVNKDFADVEDRGGQTYGAAAAAFLFELDHLQVGMAAPDFEAVDQDGVRFKLSDYAGKVVLVDFWGFW